MPLEYSVARRRMVREQLEGAGVCDPRVLQAMRDVPRHFFVPRLLHPRSHQPCALPIGFGQTISRPFTVGLMSSLLELKGHEHVLEVGTGSGYQGAILARLARSVVSVERIQPLADLAASNLKKLSLENIEVLAYDGTCGLADRAPFDAIMVTACAPDLSPHLVSQLKDGGFLLVPVTQGHNQVLFRYQRQGEEVLVEQSVSCQFVPLLPGIEASNQIHEDTPTSHRAGMIQRQNGDHLA